MEISQTSARRGPCDVRADRQAFNGRAPASVSRRVCCDVAIFQTGYKPCMHFGTMLACATFALIHGISRCKYPNTRILHIGNNTVMGIHTMRALEDDCNLGGRNCIIGHICLSGVKSRVLKVIARTTYLLIEQLCLVLAAIPPLSGWKHCFARCRAKTVSACLSVGLLAGEQSFWKRTFCYTRRCT